MIMLVKKIFFMSLRKLRRYVMGLENFPITNLTLIKTFLVILLCYGVFKLVTKIRRDKRRKRYPKDVVILHQFPRGLRAPSASPFPIKVETWLRMAGIKYQNEFSITERSPKGKVPWITYNGEDISDSQFAIEFLMKKFNKDFSAHLSPTEKSIARAFLKLGEESARWAGVVHRFKYGKPEDAGIPKLAYYLVKRKMINETMGQGYGRHSKEELYSIGKADLTALENFLGDKKFLMGDRICNEDASLFGLCCQVLYHDRGPMNQFVMNECPNIQRYVETIKNLYWTDWNEVVQEKEKPKTN